MGHFGFTADTHILHFIREFGLILFVFCIGLQVGPSFFSSFKKGGMTLNLLAVGIVVLNIAVALGLKIHRISLSYRDTRRLPLRMRRGTRCVPRNWGPTINFVTNP